MTTTNSTGTMPQDPAAQGTPGQEGKYVYAIIESEDTRGFGRIGIGSRGDSVYTIHYGGLAAVVSNTPIMIHDPTRDNVLAHENVNETVMREFTVIPMSFSTVFRTEDDVVEFLKHTADALRDVLRKMKDKIEFGLKVNWDVDTVLGELEKEREDIRRLKEGISSNRTSSTYFARVQLGRLIEQAMTEKAASYVREIYDKLRPVATASRENKPIGEKMILNSAFLIERAHAAEFEKTVQEMASKYEGRLRLTPSGPWPPYNFVNIRLRLERAGVRS
ncbi:MAG: GvpL/GvpF family gas vesicle protein [Chloroflexi bacterium]|nr:GvpL/GvpF family gas vesicle protein [Chloroflexota bacterium]